MDPGREPEREAVRQRLNALVEHCLERVEREGSAAIEAVCTEAPELAEDLRRRLAMLEGVGLLDFEPGSDCPEDIGGYRVVELLGEGGMGLVYRAFDPRLEREVALKLLRPERLLHPGARSRFLREAEAAGRLQHPGIVMIHGAGEHRPEGASAGVPYLAMELVEGESLAQVLHRVGGRAPESLAATDLHPKLRGSWTGAVTQLVRDVADALQHAHERGVLHRDVKPANVVVDGEGRARLLDFGLARALGGTRLTRTGVAVGSLEHMAPEQFGEHSGELDARVDVFGLGATLYELLTLQSAFQAVAPEETLRKIREGDFVRPTKRVPTLSKDLEAVCCRALEPRALARYASAAAFGEDLENLLALRPVVARRSTVLRRARAVARRRPELPIVGGLLLLTLIGLPLALRTIQGRAERQVQLSSDRAQESEARLNRLFDAVFEAVDPNLLDLEQLEQAYGELVDVGAGALVQAPAELQDLERLLVLASTSLNRGARGPARSALEAALAGIRGAGHLDADALLELEMWASLVLGALELEAGDQTAAEAHARAVLELDARLPESGPGSASRGARVARVHGMLAELLWREGDSSGALAELAAGTERLQRVPLSDAGHLSAASLHDQRGRIHGDLGEHPAALAAFRAALALHEELRSSAAPEARRDLHAATLRAVAHLEGAASGADAAFAHLAEAADVLELELDVAGTPDNATTGEIYERAAVLLDLSMWHLEQGAAERSDALAERAAEVSRLGMQRFESSLQLVGQLSDVLTRLSGRCLNRGQFAASIVLGKEALGLLEDLLEVEDVSPLLVRHWRRFTYTARYHVAASASMSGDRPGALLEYERLLLEMPLESPLPEVRSLRVTAALEGGVCLSELGRSQEAFAAFDACERDLAALDALVVPGAKSALLRSALVRCRANACYDASDFAGAATLYEQYEPVLMGVCEEFPLEPNLGRDRREQLESQVYLWVQAEQPERAHAAADRLRELGGLDELAAELSISVEGTLKEFAPRSGD